MSRRKALLLGLPILFLCYCISSCKASPVTIITYANTPEAEQSSTFTVKANTTSIFVERFQAIDYVRFAAGTNSFSLEITASENINTYKISPTTANVTTGTVNGDKLTIAIPSVPFHCVVEINSLRLICIFADPLESGPPQLTQSNVVNVMDFVTDNTGVTDQHDNIVNAINYVCSSPGKDTLYFPNGSYLTSPLLISDESNLNIYLKDGVLLKTTVADPTPSGATIRFDGCNNCKLFGRGVIDNKGREQYELNGAQGSKNGIEAFNSSYMTFKDFINRNSNTWQFVNKAISNATFFNVKDICTETGVFCSTDGLSIHNSHDVTVDYMFAMSKDDTLIISADNFGNSLPCYNITVDHFTGYGIGANCIAMGCTPYPGSYVSNVTIENSNFRTGGIWFWWYQMPIKIETGPSYYENIRFKNIRFDNNSTRVPYISTKSWPDGYDSYIYVKGDLELSDCTFENETDAGILGDETKKINNLIVHNLKLGEKVRTSLSDANMTVSNINSIDFTP